METKVKTASKNYTCSKCGCRINSGTEYQDNSGQTQDGRWWHRRVCMSCSTGKSSDNLDLLYERVFKKLENEGPFEVSVKDSKFYVVGLSYSLNKNRYIQLCRIDKKEAIYECLEAFVNYVDKDGNKI